MIHESYYWRKELVKISKSLKKRIQYKKAWKDSKYAKFEKEIMFGFYIIRKLLEANKLTSDFSSLKLECKVYSSNGKQITLMNNHRFDECYDLENPKTEKKDLRFFINQFVHSYIFSLIISVVNKEIESKMDDESLTEDEIIEIYENAEKELTGVFFNSDDNKNKSLFELDINTIRKLFKKVGKCNVTRVEIKYNERKKDYVSVRFSGEQEISEETEQIIKKL
ncbi:hypothetical protein [Ascidiimonas sp. W6]|uniref:hypothetical protein n=1 Tax=Ascidiimonas meishanensis TaxID=3128903 RepID=UPI0030EB1791